MTRLNGKQLEAIKNKLGVDRIWSFSKMSTFEQCTWLYKLKYIDRMKGKQDSCYTYWGTIAHDIRQGFYDGVYKSNAEMLAKLEEEIAKYLTEDKKSLRFPNKSEHIGYFDNLRHYFANCTHLTVPVENEKVVISVLKGEHDKYVFQGYIDSFYHEDGKNVILDYKTSSINGFSGEKLMDKSKQLMVYAYGLWKQQGIPIETIVLRFDMMKYCKVSYPLKNGSIKVTKCDRRGWVANISNQIRKDIEDIPKAIEKLEKDIAKLMKKRGAKCRTEQEIIDIDVEISVIESEIEDFKLNVYDIFELNEMVSKAIDENNLNSLPKFIQDKYKVEDCLIDVELNEDIIEGYMNEMIETLVNVIQAEKEEPVESFNRSRIVDSESYFCNNLCDMRDNCKFYQEYREHLDMFMDKNVNEQNSDDAILAMLGL